jgi:hypothetical protein
MDFECGAAPARAMREDPRLGRQLRFSKSLINCVKISAIWPRTIPGADAGPIVGAAGPGTRYAGSRSATEAFGGPDPAVSFWGARAGRQFSAR